MHLCSFLEVCTNVRFKKHRLSYRSSTLQLTSKPPRKSGLRDSLTLKCSDIFDVTCKSCISFLAQGPCTHVCILLCSSSTLLHLTAHRPSRKANPPRQQVGSKVTTTTRDLQQFNRTATTKVFHVRVRLAPRVNNAPLYAYFFSFPLPRYRIRSAEVVPEELRCQMDHPWMSFLVCVAN